VETFLHSGEITDQRQPFTSSEFAAVLGEAGAYRRHFCLKDGRYRQESRFLVMPH